MDRTVDGLEGVFAFMDDSRVGSLDRQTHLLHLEAFFDALAAKGLVITLEKYVFAVPTLEILGHPISAAGLASMASHAARIESCLPSTGHQATAAFSWYGELLLPFLAKLCTGVAPFKQSPEGGAKNVGVDRHGAFQIQNTKISPSCGGAPSASSPQVELSFPTDASNTHIGSVTQ
jgi:hypothetical protein